MEESLIRGSGRVYPTSGGARLHSNRRFGSRECGGAPSGRRRQPAPRARGRALGLRGQLGRAAATRDGSGAPPPPPLQTQTQPWQAPTIARPVFESAANQSSPQGGRWKWNPDGHIAHPIQPRLSVRDRNGHKSRAHAHDRLRKRSVCGEPSFEGSAARNRSCAWRTFVPLRSLYR